MKKGSAILLALMFCFYCMAEERTAPGIVGAAAYRVSEYGTGHFTFHDIECCLKTEDELLVCDYLSMLMMEKISVTLGENGFYILEAEGEGSYCTAEIWNEEQDINEYNGQIAFADSEIMLSRARMTNVIWLKPGLTLMPPRGIDIGATLNQLLDAFEITNIASDGSVYEGSLGSASLFTDEKGERLVLKSEPDECVYELTYYISLGNVSKIVLLSI